MPTPDLPEKISNFEDVIRIETEHLMRRRAALTDQAIDQKEFESTKLGIALSGGGIRSATINLGFLKTLNKFGLLKKADYLSTVSGGGYTGAYVQATLKKEGNYDQLFAEEHIDYLRSRGEYLLPGNGWAKKWNTLLFTVGYVISTLMSWISPLIVFLMLYLFYAFTSQLLDLTVLANFGKGLAENNFLDYGLIVLVSLFVMHYIANLTFTYELGLSRKFNKLESVFIGLILGWMGILFLLDIGNTEVMEQFDIWKFPILIVGLFALGFFSNPNALSFHRFYRTQLADAFLHFTATCKNIKISKLFETDPLKAGENIAPYPIINTCLNLQAVNDEKFKGTKANDYFLLSPLYCGAKLTGYVKTSTTEDYEDITLPAATTISAAAVNPGMGVYSNKALSVIMTVLNARLGFWIHNPLKNKSSSLVWWPMYFFYELFSLIGTDNRKLNISDGGHIENMAVYELLRRRCRLIIAVDAGADSAYSFRDLENLTIRARNELGLEIRFRPDHQPEEVIRPKSSHGYSKKRYALADIVQLWEEIVPLDDDGKMIRNRQGKPVEILINYKKVKDNLSELESYESDELRVMLDRMNLSATKPEDFEKLGNDDSLTSGYNDLPYSDKNQEIVRSLIGIFNEVRLLIDQQIREDILLPAHKNKILKTILSTIDHRVRNELKVSTLVYVKSAVTAPDSKLQIYDRNSLDFKTYKYKVYHPAFPQEPTSDQFFDEVQWESYFRLGQYIGADVLGTKRLKKYMDNELDAPQFNFDDLICRFDEEDDIFAPKPKVMEPEIPMVMDAPMMSPAPMSDAAPLSTPEPIPTSMETTIEEPAAADDGDKIKPPKAKKIVVGGEDNFSI